MEIFIIAVLILLNGVFSMSEIALVSSRKFKLESAARKGDKNAQRALELSNAPDTFLSTVQIGITLIGILTGIFSGDRITSGLEAKIATIPLVMPYAHSIAVGIVVVIITYFSIVFGELVPKRIGLTYPETIAKFMALPMYYVSISTKPFIWLLAQTNNAVLKLFRIKPSQDSKATEEEIKAIIQESTDGGEIQEIEQSIVERVFALGDRKISELMTHRTDMIWLDIDDDLATVKQKAGDEIHSVYPVARGSVDDLVGVVTIKQLFPLSLNEETFSLAKYIKQPLYVHDKVQAYKLLEIFKEHKTHYAVVTDEYGATQGIITMDDLMDALVGDMSEMHQDEYSIQQRSETSWLADGQVPFFEFLNYFQIPDDGHSKGEYKTLAGFIIHHLRHIPKVGETFNWQEYSYEVIDMDGRRVDKILITKVDQTPEEAKAQ